MPRFPASFLSQQETWVNAANGHTGCVTLSTTQPVHKHNELELWILHVTKTKAVLLNYINSLLSGSLQVSAFLCFHGCYIPNTWSQFPPRNWRGATWSYTWFFLKGELNFLPITFQGASLTEYCSAEKEWKWLKEKRQETGALGLCFNTLAPHKTCPPQAARRVLY